MKAEREKEKLRIDHCYMYGGDLTHLGIDHPASAGSTAEMT